MGAETTAMSPSACPTAFAVSMAVPPPMPMTTSAPAARAASATRSISFWVQSPPKTSLVSLTPAPEREAVTAASTKPQTPLSARTTAFVPRRAVCSPRSFIAPAPCTYLGGLIIMRVPTVFT